MTMDTLPSQSTGQRRWLFVDGNAVFGGHEAMLLRLVEELTRSGAVTPRVLARAGTTLQERSAPWATPSALAPVSHARSPVALLTSKLRDLRALADALRTEDPELCVLADGCLLAQPLLTLACRLAGRRFAIYLPLSEPTTELGFRSGPIRDLAMKVVFKNLPDAWVLLTRDQALAFARWTGARRPILVLPNTVTPRIEELARADAPARPIERELRVLVLGRLESHQKGLDLLLAHLEQQASRVDALTVTLVGNGPDEPRIRQSIERSPVLQRVLRIEPWSDPVDVLERHDVLLLPSRFEGVPLVMLEAMAAGVPVVASDLPGTRPFLSAECLFPVGDLTRAFAAIDRLRDPEVLRRVVRENRRTFAAQASGTAFSEAAHGLVTAMGEPRGAATSAAENTLVSVYLPTRNRLELLRKAVSSVLNQTHAAIELVVVNDASTDDTSRYLDELAVADPRVRVLHNAQSRGAPASRNLAIHAAHGEYVTGLDDDDEFEPRRIEQLLAAWQTFSHGGAAISAVFSLDRVRRGGIETTNTKPDFVHQRDLFFHNVIGNQVFTRKSFLLAVDGFDEQMPAWQDLDLFIRLLGAYGPARRVNEPLYVLNLEPRTDRISVGSKARILAAYRRLAAKFPDEPAECLQGLFLQAFDDLYRHELDTADLKEFFRRGLHPRTLKTLARIAGRNLVEQPHTIRRVLSGLLTLRDDAKPRATIEP